MPATTQFYTCAACKKAVAIDGPHIVVQRIHIQLVPAAVERTKSDERPTDVDFTDVAVCDKTCFCALVPNPDRPELSKPTKR